MHAANLLEEALAVARQLGYEIRYECLGGSGGGACHYADKKWMFVDLAAETDDQIERVLQGLARDPATAGCQLPAGLAGLMNRRAA